MQSSLPKWHTSLIPILEFCALVASHSHHSYLQWKCSRWQVCITLTHSHIFPCFQFHITCSWRQIFSSSALEWTDFETLKAKPAALSEFLMALINFSQIINFIIFYSSSGICLRSISSLAFHDSERRDEISSNECRWLCQVLCSFQKCELSKWLPLLQPQGKCECDRCNFVGAHKEKKIRQN